MNTDAKSSISTQAASRGVGPYSQGVKANGFVFVSGQLGSDPGSRSLVSGGAYEQAMQSLNNISQILQAADCNWGDVVKCTLYLANMNDFEVINQFYATFCLASPLHGQLSLSQVYREGP